MSFIETFDETTPAGRGATGARSLGDDYIREFKRAEVERQSVDHDRRDVEDSDPEKDTIPSGTIGYHKKATLIKRDVDPAQVADANIIYSKEVAGKVQTHVLDDDGAAIQITKDGGLNGDAVKGTIPAAALSVLLPILYPVGSLYISTLATNPATLLGIGTWVAFGEGKVPVGYDSTDSDFNAGEKTGGEKTHTLTIPEMPAHTHSYTLWTRQNESDGLSSAAKASSTADTGSTGGGTAHNNLQPYIVVYMWKRTA